MARTIGSRRRQESAGRFVGRFTEQQMFRATLGRLAALRGRGDDDLDDDDLSYAQIFLVAAEGGMGKTTLLRRFETIVQENKEGSDTKVLYLDLDRHTPIADANMLMGVLHDALCGAGLARELQPFRDALAKRAETQRKAADAEERFKSVAGLGGKAVQLATGGVVDKDLAAEGIHAGARGLAELREFIRKRLDPDEWRLYDDPVGGLTDALMAALNSIAAPRRPLALLLDTYEVADHCDNWLRERALPQSNPRLVWVIAGREGQPFIRRYEDAFGASLVGRIPLDTFARPDVVAYLRQCGMAEPPGELIDRLQALSRGIPLALEGWFNLYQKNVELPPPDPAAPTTRSEIVRTMTDRFLRYCSEDDKHLPPHARRAREETRNRILALMLLRHTDVDALAAAWQCASEQAEALLNDLADQFSFIFAQEIEREPHALVKEFLCQHVRGLPELPAAIRNVVARLVEHFEGRLRERERELWGLASAPSQALSDERRTALEEQRQAHQQTLQQLEIQIAKFTATGAPVGLLNQRADAERAIAALDAQLAEPTVASGAERPRRPLWADATWRELLLDLVNALCWAERGGERVLPLLAPMFVEALEFEPNSAAGLLATVEAFAERWPPERRRLFATFAAGRGKKTSWSATKETMLAILGSLQPAADNWRLTSLQRAILQVQRGYALLDPLDSMQLERRAEALAAADEATRLLPADGGEVVQSLAALYKEVGSAYLWRKRDDPVASPEAERALAAAVRFAPKDQYAWYELGVVYRRLKQYDDALAASQEAIRLDPTDAYAYNGLGNVYRARKQYDAAITAYQEAIRLDPTFAYPRDGLGNVYYDRKQYDDAITAYQEAIRLDPTDAYPHHGLGNVYRNRKQYDAAITAYQEAIRLDPTDAYPHHGLGNMLSVFGRNTEARTAYQRAIELDPADYRSMGALARLERQAGDQASAAMWVDRARPLLPADDFYNRACLESIAGNVDAAVEALRAALERQETSVEWARDDPDFVFIRDDPRYRALVGLDS